MSSQQIQIKDSRKRINGKPNDINSMTDDNVMDIDGRTYTPQSTISGKTFLAIILLSVTVILLCGLGIASFFMVLSVGNNLSVHRYCFFMNNDLVFSVSGGDPDGFTRGYVEIDLNNHEFKWHFHCQDLGTIEAITLMGPVSKTTPKIATKYLPISSDTLSLNQAECPGQISGKIVVSSDDLNYIINHASLFYFQIDTTMFSPAIIGQLAGECRLV